MLTAVVACVTKDMCCHCCVTADMSLMWRMTKCHWCDERHALSLHILSLLLAKRHLLSMMWRKACVATVQFSSTQSLRRFPDDGFETVPSDWRWPSLVLSSKIVECSSFHASTPGDRWCHVLGFVFAGSVSSSSTFQISRNTRKRYKCDVRKSLFYAQTIRNRCDERHVLSLKDVL